MEVNLVKTVEGLLRYDVLDLESWCFDMGYQVICVRSGMEIRFLIDDRFLRGRLLEIPDGGLNVVFNDKRRNQPWSYVLEQGQRYPAKMAEEDVEKVLDESRLLNLPPDNPSFSA